MEIKKIVTGALEENCYVLSKDGTCLIVDPGSDSKKIKELVGQDKILGVLVTHSHFDHIGALRDFLNMNRRMKIFKKSNLTDLKEIEIGSFKFIPIFTPGHSSDSVTFYFQEEKVMFVGDFIFKDTVGRCDLPTGSSKDMDLSIAKIKKYEDDITVYTGHGEDTTLGREKEYNLYFLGK
ncbi:MAG TPA: MBL fold metallo-hydrolase [Candidatus Onthousia faecavium]|nr:MBL fold metallo-hydrolase [Candidatus Onthousia faecavium]